MNLEDCLPRDLLPATITRIGIGMSGAGVYRVVSSGTTLVLKVAPESQPIEVWRAKVAIQRAAAAVGIAPRIIHIDDANRAVLSEHVVDRGFPMFVMNPATRDAAIASLGQTLRRLHDVPVPPGPEAPGPRDSLAMLSAGLAGVPVPRFAAETIEQVLAATPPPADREPVLGHNDVNPSNIAFDGERIVLLDWDVAGASDPLYDLASIATFMRFDDATCLQLIAAHDGKPVGELSARFIYLRRLVATLCGAMLLHLAHGAGHRGGDETLDSAPTLVELYGRLRAGAVDLSTGEGRWQFGLALLKTAASPSAA